MSKVVASAIPIVVIHRGYSWYLPYTLRQVRLFNPRSPIYLVTDQKRLLLRRLAKVVPMGDHLAAGQEFERHYKHLSHNEIEFEKFCFVRWFVLQSVMKERRLERCFYLDSDVLIYANLQDVGENFAQAKLTVNFEQGPYCTYVNCLSNLEGYCGHITELFTEHFEEMSADFASWKQAGLNGGISDMHALKSYVKASGTTVADTAEIIDDSCFDSYIHQADGFEMKDGVKAVQWRDGIPYVRHLESGKLIRFHSLHMQGTFKNLILTHYSKPTWDTKIIGLYNRLFS